MREIHALFVLVVAVIIVGLILRYGASSVPLAQTTAAFGQGVLDDLTLKGSGYPYYKPESPKGK